MGLKPLRIVLVISSLITGGAETQVIAMSRELSRRGHAVMIYTLNDNNPRAPELDGSGVEIVADQKRMKLDLAVLYRLRKFIKSYRADIVHGFLYDGDLYSRLAATGTGISALNSERNDNYRLSPTQRMGLWATRHLAACVVANTIAGAQFARKMYEFPASRVHTVWNGIDLDRVDKRLKACTTDYRALLVRTTQGLNPNLKIACLVGSIKPPKDYLLALDVAHRLTSKEKDWRIIFLGDQLSNTGEYKTSVMAKFHALKLEDRVFFIGVRNDVPEILRQCDVVFSTSLHEGFPNVVLEAMAVNTPVVSTEYSDIRAILPNSWQIVSNRQPQALADAIHRAYEERQAVAETQRIWVEQNATQAISATNLETIYRQYA